MRIGKRVGTQSQVRRSAHNWIRANRPIALHSNCCFGCTHLCLALCTHLHQQRRFAVWLFCSAVVRITHECVCQFRAICLPVCHYVWWQPNCMLFSSTAVKYVSANIRPKLRIHAFCVGFMRNVRAEWQSSTTASGIILTHILVHTSMHTCVVAVRFCGRLVYEDLPNWNFVNNILKVNI